MDQLTTVAPSVKHRRRFSAEFKAKVLAACDAPNQSVASVAHQYDLNANLLHKWRRASDGDSTSEFVRLPAPAPPVVANTLSLETTVRIELSGGIVVHWPVDKMDRSVSWIKAMKI